MPFNKFVSGIYKAELGHKVNNSLLEILILQTEKISSRYHRWLDNKLSTGLDLEQQFQWVSMLLQAVPKQFFQSHLWFSARIMLYEFTNTMKEIQEHKPQPLLKIDVWELLGIDLRRWKKRKQIMWPVFKKVTVHVSKCLILYNNEVSHQ